MVGPLRPSLIFGGRVRIVNDQLEPDVANLDRDESARLWIVFCVVVDVCVGIWICGCGWWWLVWVFFGFFLLFLVLMLF